MANTVKKTTSTVKEVSEKKVDKPDENALLKAQIAGMQAKMDAMARMVGVNNATNTKSNGRNIKFVNLFRGTVVLQGSQFWEIEGQYNTRVFSEKEARLIVANMGNFIASGAVYIDDAEFVADMDLDAIYATLLSDQDLKALLEHDASYVISTYKSVNDTQKNIIVDTVIDMRANGKFVDNNILVELGKLSGKNLLDVEQAEDEKER